MKQFLSGNEAIARGVLQNLGAGHAGVGSYYLDFGFPDAARNDEICSEWLVNEKVALHVSIGAAYVGMHIFEDHFLAEIIDPETGDQMPFGEAGELVFTALTKEAMLVISYRTLDRTMLHSEKWACGRTMVRMEKVFGRTDNMLIMRGVNVFPQLSERSLMEVDGLAPQYQIVIDRQQDSMDTLDIMVETAPDYNWDDNEQLENLRRHTAQEIHQALGITAEIKLMEPKTIERSIGKARRVIDKRELSGE